MTTITRTSERPFQLLARFLKGWEVLKGYPLTLLSGMIVVLFFFMALLGPVVAPYGYAEIALENRLLPPALKYLCGTDQFGRDILSRILIGSRDVLVLSGSGTLLAVFLGLTLGLFSGYRGGLFDEIVMRLLDAVFSIPPLLFALLLLGAVGSSRINIVIVLGIRFSPIVARVVRSIVLDTKTKEYVEAAKMRGECTAYIVFREILPSVLPSLIVEVCIRFSYSIFLIASLGFLGLGIQPPAPDWGMMVGEARNWIRVAPWMMMFPAMAVAILVISVNLMADGLGNILQIRALGERR
jgi:peptide/nickel transport system permease protein